MTTYGFTVDGNLVYLTDVEVQTLEAIEEFMLVNNVPPTVRELCEMCELKSTATMNERVRRLALKGVVKRLENTSRGITSMRVKYVKC